MSNGCRYHWRHRWQGYRQRQQQHYVKSFLSNRIILWQNWPGYEDFLRRMPYHLLLQIMRPTFVFFLSRFVSADTIAEMSSHRPICLFIRPFVRSSIHLFSVWKSFLAHTDLPNWIYSQPFYKSIRRRCHGNCGRMEVRRSGGFNSF